VRPRQLLDRTGVLGGKLRVDILEPTVVVGNHDSFTDLLSDPRQHAKPAKVAHLCRGRVGHP